MTSPEALLAATRHQAQRGNLAGAIAGYESCLQQQLPVHQEYAGLLYQHGHSSRAAQVITAALETAPEDAHLYFLRALALIAGGQSTAALADLDTSLQISPDNLAALRQRANLLAQLDLLDAALADFQKIHQLAPHDADALGNCGIIHLRRNEYTQAAGLLELYLQRYARNPQIVRSLANTYRSMGNLERALPMLAGLDAQFPRADAVQTDYALALLAARQFDQAQHLYQTVAKRSPGDQWALSGLYIVSAARCDTSAARRLMPPDLVLPADDGNLLDRDVLKTQILSHPRLRWEPAGKSTTGGQQTTLLELDTAAFKPLSTLLHQRVEQAFSTFDPLASEGTAHPWFGGRPAKWKLQVWATVLHGEGGHQRPHIHPAGWLSGVYYLDSGDPHLGEGMLVFGHPPDELQLPAPQDDFSHQPRSGQLLFFPSFFLHHTTPYIGSTARISIAFDVVPVS